MKSTQSHQLRLICEVDCGLCLIEWVMARALRYSFHFIYSFVSINLINSINSNKLINFISLFALLSFLLLSFLLRCLLFLLIHEIKREEEEQLKEEKKKKKWSWAHTPSINFTSEINCCLREYWEQIENYLMFLIKYS